MTSPQGPRRIACLSTEAVEVLYRLGAQDRIAGISGYTVHPPEARRDKPKVSGFSTARMERLLAVRVRERPGWDRLDPTFCEVKSADILSPGPAAIERGLPQLLHHIARRTGVSPADLGLPPGTPEHE